jgi:hypothetical protein
MLQVALDVLLASASNVVAQRLANFKIDEDKQIRARLRCEIDGYRRELLP